MAWITIQESDVLTVIAGAELAGYRAAALANDQPDPVAEQIANVTNEVRGYVAGSSAGPSAMGAEGTIPSELLQASLDILAVKIPSRAAGIDPTKVRADALDRAYKTLDKVTANRFRIEMPTVLSTAQIAVPLPSISNPRRGQRARTRREEDGL